MNSHGKIFLSLFDGMGCLQIALIEAGIPIGKYYASEIDKHAMKETQLNFPDTVQLGSVTEWQTWNIDWSTIDFIGAGSPCQGFSFAGKQLAFDDPRSKLFFVFIDILNHCRKFNPDVKFLLENVDMKKEHMAVINQFTGLFPVNINSNLVSAQNRSRNYWSNIRTRSDGLFGEIHTDIPQPKDRGIFLKDILEENVDEKYYLSDTALEYLYRAKTKRTENVKYNNGCEKTSTITANYSRGVHNCGETYVKLDKNLNPKYDQLKASCFTAGGNSGGNHSDMDLICVAMRGRGENNEQQLEPNHTGKTNTLTSVQKDNLIMFQRPRGNNKGGERGQEGTSPSISSSSWEHNNFVMTERQKRNHRQLDEKANAFLSTSWKGSQANGMTLIGGKSRGNRIQRDADKSVTLLGGGGGGGAKTGLYNIHSRIRRLTPTECATLQTIPSWYKWDCSDTQIYRMCGNGWTVEVIKHILSFLPEDWFQEKDNRGRIAGHKATGSMLIVLDTKEWADGTVHHSVLVPVRNEKGRLEFCNATYSDNEIELTDTWIEDDVT